jgi:hypothetical protein
MAASLLAGVVGTTGLAMAPANAVAPGTTFFAQEIFAPEGAPAVTAPCGGTTPIADMAKPADLPAGTTASIVVIGPYNGSTTVGTCTVYNIGGVKVAAVAGHRLDKGLPVAGRGGVLKAVTAAAVTADGSTKLVAEKVVNRNRTTTPTAPAEVELAYVADVTALTTGAIAWTVRDKAGVELKLDVTAAEIDEGLGSDVTAQFLTAPAPPD